MVRVSYEEHEQLAFNDWMNIRLKRAQEWESMISSVQSETCMIDSVAVDEELNVSNREAKRKDTIVSLQGFDDF